MKAFTPDMIPRAGQSNTNARPNIYDSGQTRTPINQDEVRDTILNSQAYRGPNTPITTPSTPSLTPKPAPSFQDYKQQYAQKAQPQQQGFDFGKWLGDTVASPVNMVAGAAQSALDTSAGLMESGLNALTGKNVRGKTINETTGYGMNVQPGVEKTSQGLSMMGQGLAGQFGRNPFNRTTAESDKDTQNFLFGAAKLGSGLIGNAFSPLGGAISQAPQPVQQGMGLVGQGFNAIRNIAPNVTGTGDTPWGDALGDAFDIGSTVFAPQVSKGLGKAAGKAGGIMKDAGKFIGRETARRLTGIGPELQKNISTLLKPVKGEAKLGSTLDDAVRGKISYETVIPKITKALQDKADMGEAMKGEIIPMLQKQGKTVVKLSTDKVDDVLREFGLEHSKNGINAIGGDARNTSLTSQQIKVFDEVINEMRKSTTASPLQFWNTRSKLGKVLNTLEKKGMKDANAQALSDVLYNKWNELGRSQIKGLDKFDDIASSNISALEPIKRKLFDGESNLQAKAEYVIEQLNNKSQANLKKAIENIVPGISKEMLAVKTANMLKGIEANPTGSGNLRNWMLPASGMALLGGNPIGAAVGAGTYALTNPSLLTKGAIAGARAAQKVAPSVRKVSGVVNKVSNSIKSVAANDAVKRALAALASQEGAKQRKK